ncbi:STN domain-containing protein [Niabella sp. W65]|nr:STN domain-containing protein [Niabella sp. W65]MCH7365350.1 STN domain-containing protein [Niabella sp. W65]ULT41146.1 STN domain-containing protein [Niabella sp. I65]
MQKRADGACVAENRKTNGVFLFYNDQLIRHADPVSLTVTRAPLKDVLNRILSPIGLGYSIEDKVVIISKLTEKVILTDQGKNAAQRGQPVSVLMQNIPG